MKKKCHLSPTSWIVPQSIKTNNRWRESFKEEMQSLWGRDSEKRKFADIVQVKKGKYTDQIRSIRSVCGKK